MDEETESVEEAVAEIQGGWQDRQTSVCIDFSPLFKVVVSIFLYLVSCGMKVPRPLPKIQG